MLEYTLFNSKYCKSIGILILVVVSLLLICSCGLVPTDEQDPENSDSNLNYVEVLEPDGQIAGKKLER